MSTLAPVLVRWSARAASSSALFGPDPCHPAYGQCPAWRRPGHTKPRGRYVGGDISGHFLRGV